MNGTKVLGEAAKLIKKKKKNTRGMGRAMRLFSNYQTKKKEEKKRLLEDGQSLVVHG